MPGILDQTPPPGINPGLLSAGNLVNANAPAPMSASAIQALSDSMRTGALTAQDVIDRVGELGQTRRKAEIEMHKREIEDLKNPDLVAAKHAITLAGGQQAQLAGATAQASLPNVPLAADTQAAQLKAALWDAQLHGAGLGPMQDVLMKAGWAVPTAGAAGPTADTQQEIVRRYQAVLQHQQEMAHAQDFLAKTDKTEMVPVTERDAQGNEMVIQKPVITYGGRIFDPSARDATQKFLTDPTNLMPGTWDAKGRPASPSKGVPAPGETNQPVETVPVTDAQRAAMANTNTGTGLPPEQAAAISVLPKQTVAALPVVGAAVPGGGIVTKREVPIQDSPEKVLKDVQAKDSYKEWDKSLGYADLINQRNADTRAAVAAGVPKGIQNEKDIALTEAVIKLYDPAGVMRSFKWDKTTETRPLYEKVKELAPLLLGKEVLTDGQRDRLMTMANDLISARERIVQPDLQRIAEVEQKWGRPVLNSRERAIASGKFSGGGVARPAAQPAKPAGPVIPLSNGQSWQRDANGQYQRVQ